MYVNRRDTVSLKRKLCLSSSLTLTPISLCFTGFKLVFAYCYIILSLSVYLSPVPSPSLSSPSPFFLIPSSLCLNSHIYAPPRQSSALSITSHKGTKAKHTNQPQLTLGYSKEQESMVLVLAFWKRKTGTHQTNQPNKRKIPQRKNVFCLFTFWCISHQYSAK